MRKVKQRSRKRLIVGLTGGIATGKTIVAYIFRQFGASVICCDEIAHRALRRSSKTYKQIVHHFGRSILAKKKCIDRKKLAAVIFKNKKKRRALEAIVHPFVFRSLSTYIRNARGILIIDIPLLFETGFQAHVDYTIVVSCSRAEQVKRLMKRDALSRTEALRRLNAQFPLARKRKMADWVIHNSQINQTIVETQRVWDKMNEAQTCRAQRR